MSSSNVGVSPDTMLMSAGNYQFITKMIGRGCSIYSGIDSTPSSAVCSDTDIYECSDKLVELIFSDHNHLVCTINTEFILSDGRYIKAGNLCTGHRLLTSDKSTVVFKSFTFPRNNVPVMSLVVDRGEFVELSNHIFARIGKTCRS